MAYIKPIKEMVMAGIEYGWSKEDFERGYCIFDFDGTGLLEINRIDDVFFALDDIRFYSDGFYDVTDEDCAIEAERSGFCKIIPVEELPKNMIYDGNDRRYFGWIDTPENRRRISEFFKEQN